MSDRLRLMLLIAIAAVVACASLTTAPAPTPPPAPPPCPGPGPCPKPRRPWDIVEASVGGPRHDDGTEIACDLPNDLHLKNTGGSDGAGLCVFCSIAHAARWQNVPLLVDFRDWMRKHPGGGYPAKVDRMIERLAKEKNLARPDYLQIEGNDLELLKLACRTGRMPGVTYAFSPTGRYGGRRIAHMVNLVHADDRHFVVLDNNYPGTLEWMSPDEFRRTYAGGGQGWAVILLAPAPPPPPTQPK